MLGLWALGRWNCSGEVCCGEKPSSCSVVAFREAGDRADLFGGEEDESEVRASGSDASSLITQAGGTGQPSEPAASLSWLAFPSHSPRSGLCRVSRSELCLADKERCVELKKALCTAHEKFCFWPDSPCPDRFAMLLVDEPRALVQDFLERFQRLCQLELQLPSLRPEDMKTMSLTEEKISLLLQLIGEELEHKPEGEKALVKCATEILPVHVPACILALCGWTCSASPGSVHLSVITCSLCMRKVGLWGFQQLEAAGSELDSCSPSSASPAPAERVPLLPTSPRRMLTRSQDALPPGSSEQQEKSPSFITSRPRGWDSPLPELEVGAAAPRSRPVTRSMGQGDGGEVPSSPLRRAKRPRLCSSSSSDTSLRTFFDPTSQHRDWCPWVNAVEGGEALEDATAQPEKEPVKAEPGWRVVLNTLLSTRKCDRVPETEPVSLTVKSCKVFRIFRQWESMNSS